MKTDTGRKYATFHVRVEIPDVRNVQQSTANIEAIMRLLETCNGLDVLDVDIGMITFIPTGLME